MKYLLMNLTKVYRDLTMLYASAVKGNELLIPLSTWLNHHITMLSGRSKLANTYWVNSLTLNLGNAN